MTLSSRSSTQPVSRFSRSRVFRRRFRLWMTMLFSSGVRMILYFCFLIAQSSFSPSLYLEQSLKCKCASFTLCWDKAEKINRTSFGQIRSNQDSPDKDIALNKNSMGRCARRGTPTRKAPQILPLVAPFFNHKGVKKGVLPHF